MKVRRVYRYTCDFCKRSNCSKSSISTHEAKCFKNPNRHCTMCLAQWPIDGIAGPMAALSDANESNEAQLVEAVAKIVEHCPACVCSVLNQCDRPKVTWDNEFGDSGEHRYRFKWDYAKARDAYLNEQRREEASYVWPPRP